MIRVLCLVLGLLGTPALAQGSGPDAPPMQAAVAQWLAGDEAEALPALARLAQGGDDAARLLLALIDMTAAYQGDWLGGLDRTARIALMRRPGGLSGQSWLDIATGPVAQAWRDLLDTSAGPGVVLAFAALGEDRAAVFAARTLHRRQNRDLAQAMAAPDVPAYLRRFAGGGDMPPPDDGPWAVIDTACATHCPGEAEACRKAVSTALHGDIAMAGSPAAPIIAPDEWAASAKGQAALLRLIATSGWRGDGPACLQTALAGL